MPIPILILTHSAITGPSSNECASTNVHIHTHIHYPTTSNTNTDTHMHANFGINTEC